MANEDKTEQTKRRIRCTLEKIESATSSEGKRAASSESERGALKGRERKSIEQLEAESRIIRNL